MSADHFTSEPQTFSPKKKFNAIVLTVLRLKVFSGAFSVMFSCSEDLCFKFYVSFFFGDSFIRRFIAIAGMLTCAERSQLRFSSATLHSCIICCATTIRFLFIRILHIIHNNWYSWDVAYISVVFMYLTEYIGLEL